MNPLTKIRTAARLKTARHDDLPQVARSVAIIMDGSGRWAAARGLPAAAGHREGTRALRQLWLAFGYAGRAEVVDAARGVIEAGVEPEELDEELFAAHLYAPEMPDPDLLIRTSGELRVSNFLLWQLAYAELVFVEGHWPDFGGDELRVALDEYARRRRRFGGR